MFAWNNVLVHTLGWLVEGGNAAVCRVVHGAARQVDLGRPAALW